MCDKSQFNVYLIACFFFVFFKDWTLVQWYVKSDRFLVYEKIRWVKEGEIIYTRELCYRFSIAFTILHFQWPNSWTLCVCVCACVRACVSACVRACVRVWFSAWCRTVHSISQLKLCPNPDTFSMIFNITQVSPWLGLSQHSDTGKNTRQH